MNKKYKTKTIKLPVKLSKQLDLKVVENGYGLRGTSRWINDAIKQLLTFYDQDFIVEMIENTDDIENLDTSICFTYDVSITDLLDKWVLIIRNIHPLFEGVQSKIIRACIIHKILGSIETINKLV